TPIAGVAPGSGWNYLGSGDFNGDGTSDILWQNGSTLAIWTVQNGAFSQSAVVNTAAPAGYAFAGVGDYNGDGTSDMLWRDATNGQTQIWTMANNQVSETFNPGGADPSFWHVAPT